MAHKLKKLPFETNSLEPYMDEETVKIHYEKHHQGYVDKLNQLLENFPELKKKDIEWLLENVSELSEEVRQRIINFAGGVYNHDFFWSILKKEIEFNPESEIGKEIISKFNSFEEFQEQFENLANSVFGSGWTWLVLKDNQLEIVQTANQASVISEKMIPLMAIDLWEHSYYLKYQNKRTEFIKNFWNIINWEKVNELFISSKT